MLILPSHSSCLTQPLDVGVFGPLKKMAGEIAPLIRLGIARIQKVESLAAFVTVYENALSAQKILSRFCVPGMDNVDLV